MIKKVLRIIFIIIGALLIADTIFVLTISNMNLGVILPALLGIPLFLYGIFQRPLDTWFSKGFGKFIKWFFIAGYLFLTAVFVIFSIQMNIAAHTAPPADADAIIVLGAGLKNAEPTLTLANRLDQALFYYTQNPNSFIVVSGGFGHGQSVSEAQAMQDYLTARGVAPQKILKEEKSTSTGENFAFSKKILDDVFKKPYTIVYVTNDFHILRAGMNAQHYGFDAHGLSAPSPAYVAFNSYLREALALLKATVFGL
ncbi:MAG: YdcF family protein [Christensenellaceae bacterium]